MSGARRSYGCAYRVSEQHPGPLLPLNARGKTSHRGAAALNSATALPAAHRPANRARPSSLRGGAHFCCRARRFDSTRQHACQHAPFGRAGENCSPGTHQCAWQRYGWVLVLAGSRRFHKPRNRAHRALRHVGKLAGREAPALAASSQLQTGTYGHDTGA